MITWTCDTCLRPIEDRKGYVSINPREALRVMLELRDWRPSQGRSPEVLPWRILHETCDLDPQGPEYWWDVERLRSPTGVEEFRAHMSWKNWPFTATNLETLLTEALVRAEGATSRPARRPRPPWLPSPRPLSPPSTVWGVP